MHLRVECTYLLHNFAAILHIRQPLRVTQRDVRHIQYEMGFSRFPAGFVPNFSAFCGSLSSVLGRGAVMLEETFR